MNNLKNIKEFLTEKKVTVKRRYTESHPAKMYLLQQEYVMQY